MNSVQLVGRLTRNVNLRTTRKNKKDVANFSLAVKNVSRKDRYGKPTTDFFSCVAWGVNARTLKTYAKQGTLISICGHLSKNHYEDSNGNKHIDIEIVVDSLDLLAEPKHTGHRATKISDCDAQKPVFKDPNRGVFNKIGANTSNDNKPNTTISGIADDSDFSL